MYNLQHTYMYISTNKGMSRVLSSISKSEALCLDWYSNDPTVPSGRETAPIPGRPSALLSPNLHLKFSAAHVSNKRLAWMLGLSTSWVPRPTRKHKRANKNSSRIRSLRRATPLRPWWLLTLVLFPFLPFPLNPSARILLCSGPTSCHVPCSKHEEHPLSRCQRCQRQPPMAKETLVAWLFRLWGPPKSHETDDFTRKPTI